MSAARVTAVPRLPPRENDSHKGTYGRVLVLAGSRGMAGAAALCGLGVLRGGAGLVTVACPASLCGTVTAVEPGLMTVPLPEGEGGTVDAPETEGWLNDLDGRPRDVAAVGCGLGLTDAARQTVRTIWWRWEGPVVFDADALTHLAALWEDDVRGTDGSGAVFFQPVETTGPAGNHPRVLTPHPGEFAKLIGSDVRSVQASRQTLAVKFAAERKCVLLLKGHRTLVTDGERLFENRTGNPGMATGGAGDVLTGLLAALIGQGLEPFGAACCAAHLHGRAGDLAAAELSQPGLIASDLPRFLATAFGNPGYD